MSRSEPLTLSNLPLTILLDKIMPFIHAEDLLSLTKCSTLFAMLFKDSTFKNLKDFDFPGDGTAYPSDWKFIYKGLLNPRVYVWGDKSDGRLGLRTIPKSVAGGVPYPVPIQIPGARIMSLVAGGMSFHALDSMGHVHVWGTLNSKSNTSTRGFSNSSKSARTPHKLDLPVSIRSISCGRLHSSCLDHNNDIWTFINWGRPFRLSAPVFQKLDYAPKQVECGWSFSSILTKSGSVFVWWPLNGRMDEIVQQRMEDMDREVDNLKDAYIARDGVIPCITWDLDEMPTALPAIPSLPDLPHTGSISAKEVKLVKIAAFDNYIVGVTNGGHVLKYSPLTVEDEAVDGRWEYLPNFSEVEKVKVQPVFQDSGENNRLAPPERMQITHLSAAHLHFVAYSTGASSIVLIGDTQTTPQSAPEIIPQLQYKSIVSITLGDYHNAALTSSGKLLTWGSFSNGALGLGEPLDLEPGSPGGFSTEDDHTYAAYNRHRVPPDVDVPTEVRFDYNSRTPLKRFCIAATAAGWHTGALVIDLDPGDEENETGEPIIPLPNIFRTGFADRGRSIRGFKHGNGRST